MSALMIASIEIHQDHHGRFSLNDFHRAAGGETKHQPAFFMKRPETIELIEEISNSAVEQNYAPTASKAGRYGGTYVVKELVYSYAMWVSAKFHLHVIRTFELAAANDSVIPLERCLPVAADNFDAAKRIAENLGLEGNQAILSANSMVRSAIGIDLMEMAGVKRLLNEAQELNFLPSELGAKFGMTANSMNKLLAQCGLQHHVTYKPGKKRWEVTPEGKEFAVITDTAKKHNDGKPIQQILWKESVAKPLSRLTEKL
ncbi:KilA-N domain-containing protein [Pseudomonas sp. RW10S2]|uniref:KilA-N domain-containing protein n=1 Tax=Pseudomonas sp. RW10S2 TaxID=459637 RepID=UPI001647A82B|nr:KilA-N domain-containing protein [Pseudomonas sp. RW10S2]MBC3464985.1 KilA-N domain-containing protein [Pseudomonas sp. RW10S2]